MQCLHMESSSILDGSIDLLDPLAKALGVMIMFSGLFRFYGSR